MTVALLIVIAGMVVAWLYGRVAAEEALKDRTATPEAWAAGRDRIHRT